MRLLLQENMAVGGCVKTVETQSLNLLRKSKWQHSAHTVCFPAVCVLLKVSGLCTFRATVNGNRGLRKRVAFKKVHVHVHNIKIRTSKAGRCLFIA